MSHLTFPGHELRARREELGFSSEDIYRRIRVPAQFVESIEKRKELERKEIDKGQKNKE